MKFTENTPSCVSKIGCYVPGWVILKREVVFFMLFAFCLHAVGCAGAVTDYLLISGMAYATL